MDISLINSQSLLHLLSLTEKKEELLQTVDQIDAEILRTLKGGISVNVFEVASAPAIVKPLASAKPTKAQKKSGISPEGRAKLAAAAKARWAAFRAAKTAASKKAAKPAKKNPKPD